MVSKLWEIANKNWKLTCSILTSAIVISILVGLLIAWRDANVILCSVFGTLVGWLVGILLAPYDEERKKFERWSKSLVGFLAGLSLGKIENALKLVQDQDFQRVFRMIGRSFSWFLLTAIIVFIGRTYTDPANPDEDA